MLFMQRSFSHRRTQTESTLVNISTHIYISHMSFSLTLCLTPSFPLSLLLSLSTSLISASSPRPTHPGFCVAHADHNHTSRLDDWPHLSVARDTSVELCCVVVQYSSRHTHTHTHTQTHTNAHAHRDRRTHANTATDRQIEKKCT